MRTFVLQDEDGQTKESHSISAGLDYPGVGPEHSWLAETGRAHYEPITDAEAMEAFRLLSRTEGIVPAIESAHALAGAIKLGQRLPRDADGEPPIILVNLSGRGDKDVDTAINWFDLDTTGTGSESGEPVGAERQRRDGRRSRGRRHFHRSRAGAVSLRSRAATGKAVRRRRAPPAAGALVGFLHVGYPDVPTSLHALRALTGEGDSPGRRPGRGRHAVQRPDDGRRHDPAGRHPGPRAWRPDPGRVRRRRGGRRRPAPPPW